MDWLPIEEAPKNGKRLLFGGRWKPFDILQGGEWFEEIFAWTTIMSDGTGYDWLNSCFFTPGHFYVDWTHFMPLPDPPQESK